MDEQKSSYRGDGFSEDSLKPLVTIILTVYHRSEYISLAIESVLAQDFSDYEVRIADDSHSAEIASIVSTFSDHRIKYCPNSERIGVAGSVRKNVKDAQGKYIAILNDDDCWLPSFLSELVTQLEGHPESVLAFSNHHIIDSEGNIIQELSEEYTLEYGRAELDEGLVPDLAELVMEKNGVPLAMAAVFVKEHVNPELIFDEVGGAYDFWISLILAATGRPAFYRSSYLTQYRIHDLQETSVKKKGKEEWVVFIFQKVLELNFFPTIERRVRIKLSQAYRALAKNHLVFGEYSAGRRHAYQACRYLMSFKNGVIFLLSFWPFRLLRPLILRP